MPIRFAKYWFLMFILLFSLEAIGQSILPPANGNLPGEAQYNEVSLDTLNIHLDIPIVSKAGIGLPFSFGLHYNNNIWSPFNPNLAQWSPSNGWTGGESQVAGQFVTTDVTCGSKGQFSGTIYSGYLDSNGNVHPVGAYIGLGPNTKTCPMHSSISITATDGSGFTYNLSYSSPSTVVKAAGTVLTPFATGSFSSIAVDTNNNTLSTSYSNPTTTYTDTLGIQEMQTNLSLSYGLCAGSASSIFTYPTSAGSATATLTCKPHTLQTNFGCSNAGDFPATPNWYLPDTLTLGDNSSAYSFTYESQVAGTVTGRLASVTFPTGGTVSYQYTGPNNGIDCADGSTAGLKRTTVDGTWTFTRNSSTWLSTTAADPSGNTTVVNFSQQIGPGAMFMTQRTVTQNGGTSPSQTKVFCYNGNQSNCATAAAPSYPISQTDTYTTLAGMSAAARTSTQYDAYNNVTDVKFYDFGASTPTLENSATGFGQSWNGTSCVVIGKGINNRPCAVTSYDGTHAPVSNKYFTYDGNGNLLAGSTWTGGNIVGGAYLTSQYIPNPNGTVKAFADVNGTQTSYSYTDAGECNSGLVTAKSILSLSSKYQWDCNGAVGTQVTGLDGNTAYTTYSDPLWRVTSVKDQSGVVTTTQYLTPTTVETSMTFNSGASTYNVFSTLDQMSRPLYTQTIESPLSSNWDTVQYNISFDATGMKTTSTAPCVSTQGNGCATSQSSVTRDALGRTLATADAGGGTVSYTYTGRDVLKVIGPPPVGEVAKQMHSEYDGLGRLLSECRISSATGSGPCGQDSGGSGFVTKYSYDAIGRVLSKVQNAQSATTQSRVFTYDKAGRLLTASYPESGTMQYFYDSAPSSPGVACPGTYNGDLVKTYDPNGNTACFTYDGMHRKTSATYSGPNSDGNNSYYVYDSAVVNGATMANTGGRLAEAYTSPSQAGTKVTDEGFSYSVRGEMTDLYEWTQHSNGYYHTTSTYWDNGVLKTLSGVPGNAAWSFGVDGKGRPYSAIQGASTNLVSSVTYNARSQPLTAVLGLGDSDSYTYDPNTGRMTNYTFTIGATPMSMSGNLTWNVDGTLRQLAITDHINSGSQTCNYGTNSQPGYDELGRLIMVDCGASTWQQTFSYDPFNNLTTSVPSGGTGTSWIPGYNLVNNHYALGGTSYDANGNLLNDTFHTYTWNHDNHPATIDSNITITYDALGNMVEKKVAGVYSQILFSPIGKTAVMSGQTTTNYYISLPGRATAVSGIKFLHSDWLGSARLISNLSARTANADRAFSPYGVTYKSFGSTADIDFTGDTQDTVAGTYDTPNRKLNPNQERWISPDPAHAGWNAYAYSTNPLGGADNSGLVFEPGPVTLVDGIEQGRGYPVVNELFPSESLATGLPQNASNYKYFLSQNGVGPLMNCEQGCATHTIDYYNVVPPNNYDLGPGSSEFAAAVLGLTYEMTAPTMGYISDAFMVEMMLLPGVGEIGEAAQVVDYDTYVIGNMADAATWQGVPFANVSNVPEVVYNDSIQAEWEAAAVEGGQPVTLASPVNTSTFFNQAGNPTVFSSEFTNFMNLGYTWGGQGMLLPPP